MPGDGLTYFGSVQWSPDGERIAYRRLRFLTKTLAEYMIESRDLKEGRPSIIFSNRQSYFYTDLDLANNFSWTPDGRIIYMLPKPSPNHRNRNFWEIAVDPKTGQGARRPTPHYKSSRASDAESQPC